MNATQAPFTIQAFGEVIPAPTIDELARLLSEAASEKEAFCLNPGAVRVLSDYLAGSR